VTGLTSGGLAGWVRLTHAIVELATVRVGVASGAIQVGPVVCGCRGRECGRLLVTIGAWHSDVFAGQQEARFLVARQRESRGAITVDGVAALAGIQVRRGRKLARMAVLVTIGTLLELHFEDSVSAARNVALRALHTGVRTREWIGSRRVIGNRKS